MWSSSYCGIVLLRGKTRPQLHPQAQIHGRPAARNSPDLQQQDEVHPTVTPGHRPLHSTDVFRRRHGGRCVAQIFPRAANRDDRRWRGNEIHRQHQRTGAPCVMVIETVMHGFFSWCGGSAPRLTSRLNKPAHDRHRLQPDPRLDHPHSGVLHVLFAQAGFTGE